jgi:hypothetical protein
MSAHRRKRAASAPPYRRVRLRNPAALARLLARLLALAAARAVVHGFDRASPE